MSETNIGRNLPKAHGTQPSFEGKERAKKEETPQEPKKTTTQQTELNLNRDPAFVGGQSQVKKSQAFQGAYKPDPAAVEDDALTYKLLRSAFDNEAVNRYAQQNGIHPDKAAELLCDAFLEMRQSA